ncbi:MAG: ATP-dependent Clp protease adaptor ClpS, partial [Gaiellaceae bacterium]
MSQTVELPRLGGPGSGLGGFWRVVVLNDNYNTFDHVAETLASVIPEVSL